MGRTRTASSRATSPKARPAPFFRTRLDLANPGAGGASVLLRFLTDTGARVSRTTSSSRRARMRRSIPRRSRGWPTRRSRRWSRPTSSIVVDRTMTWDASGYGSHVETGGGCAGDDVVLRRGVDLRPLRAVLPAAEPAVDRRRPRRSATCGRSGSRRSRRPTRCSPVSRTTIVVDGEGAELASTDVSAVITAASPIVAERAMYLSRSPASPSPRDTRAPA